MSLQFILGNSGSGKTDFAYRRIVSEAGNHISKNYLIIVPEQFTMQTQQKLAELAPGHAIMNIDVLSFKRLAYRVFDDLGMNDIPVLEETGKNLVLRKVAEDHSDDLTVLGANLGRMGYIEELKSLISELVQYNITPERLESYALGQELSPAFAAKLQDIVIVYRAFHKYLAGSYITAEEILHLLIEVVDQSALLKESVVILDEFTGFTPIQNHLIHRILPVVDRLEVILTMDEKENPWKSSGEHELFALTKKTVQQLGRMAEELHIAVEKPVILGESHKKRFAGNPELAFLEQQLFRPWYSIWKEKPQNIRISSCQNPREELLAAAREIRRLVQEEGYRYREIAVVTGAVDSYAGYVDSIFRKYQIPYFLDQTTAIVFHPFIECIRAALELVELDFSYSAVMRFLRCGYMDIPEAELDMIDNYLHATGITGRRMWEKRWLRQPQDKAAYDLDTLEAARKRIYETFAPLCEVFRGKQYTAAEQIQALYRVLTGLGIEERLWKREAELEEQGQQVRAKEYGQLYPMVMQLLEKFYKLLGQEHMDISTFSETLDAGLSALSVATIPPGHDNVTIGDIERTRLNHVKVLFFVGVNDGVIPKAVGRGGIISEFEREMMKEAELELAPSSREQAFIQRFYLYQNLTKPSDKLFISYSRTDSEGKAIRPSYLVNTISRLFGELKVEFRDKLQEELNLSTSAAALDYLVHSKMDESWEALARYFLENRDAACLPEQTAELLKARYMNYAAEPIAKGTADVIYGTTLKGSVTRLEQFAACAYSHFLRYGLRLQEREESGFQSVDIGNLYHDALERYSRNLEASAYDWFTVPEKVREEMASFALKEAVLGCANPSAGDKASELHQVDRMEQIFSQTVWALTEQVRAGRFVPSAFEVSFADLREPGKLRMELSENHDMELRGRIDRMDLLQEEGKTMVKVIDYKSGTAKLELIRVYQGLSLQLMVYMNMATEYKKHTEPRTEVVPAAVFYYSIDEPVLKEKDLGDLSEAELKTKFLAALRPEGLVNSDEQVLSGLDEHLESKSAVIPVSRTKKGALDSRSKTATAEEFAVIQEYVENRIRQDGRRIYEGDISINPYKSDKKDSCAYCPYSSICRIGSRIPGFETRTMPKMKDDEIIEAMKTENAICRG